MATDKKSSLKKPTTKSKSKQVTKKSIKMTKASTPKYKSFKIYRETTPFMTMRFSEQTVYWLILVSLTFLFALWSLSIQLDTLRILENIGIA